MTQKQSRYFQFRVGNIQKSTTTLVDLDYNIVQLPNYMLPQSTKPGSIIKITVERDEEEENRRDKQVDRVCQKVIKSLQNNLSKQNKILESDT